VLFICRIEFYVVVCIVYARVDSVCELTYCIKYEKYKVYKKEKFLAINELAYINSFGARIAYLE
jgi:hypothetical protein